MLVSVETPWPVHGKRAAARKEGKTVVATRRSVGIKVGVFRDAPSSNASASGTMLPHAMRGALSEAPVPTG